MKTEKNTHSQYDPCSLENVVSNVICDYIKPRYETYEINYTIVKHKSYRNEFSMKTKIVKLVPTVTSL